MEESPRPDLALWRLLHMAGRSCFEEHWCLGSNTDTQFSWGQTGSLASVLIMLFTLAFVEQARYAGVRTASVESVIFWQIPSGVKTSYFQQNQVTGGSRFRSLSEVLNSQDWADSGQGAENTSQRVSEQLYGFFLPNFKDGFTSTNTCESLLQKKINFRVLKQYLMEPQWSKVCSVCSFLLYGTILRQLCFQGTVL